MILEGSKVLWSSQEVGNERNEENEKSIEIDEEEKENPVMEKVLGITIPIMNDNKIIDLVSFSAKSHSICVKINFIV